MAEQTIIPPDLDDVLAEMKNEIFANLNCIQIGKIEKVNSNQTCEISIQFKRRVSGDQISEYPLLVDCPYFVLSGGGSFVDVPISEGDFCLVLFNDRNIDVWWSSANVKEPDNRRKHNLSDGIALVGINPETSSFSMNGNALVVNGGPFKVDLTNESGETLSGLMEDTMSEIQNIKTTGSSTNHVLDPSSVAAFVDLDTRFKTLLGSS